MLSTEDRHADSQPTRLAIDYSGRGREPCMAALAWLDAHRYYQVLSGVRPARKVIDGNQRAGKQIQSCPLAPERSKRSLGGNVKGELQPTPGALQAIPDKSREFLEPKTV